ncbi:MAG: tripartite tricarboxylate transporter substrate binding protein [Alphaproteobacteria bacterium]|nr:tripartite tricarboxylate transporter substrate binding protein [Alphaproteobacteria bacterium]
MPRALRHFLAVWLVGGGFLMGAASLAQAQSWPTRNVRFILTLGPGSGTDIGGRLLADRLTKKWGQAVVIENKTGGDGIIAIGAFVSAKDDHVLLLSPTSSFTAHPFLHDNLLYKPEDLVPIARVSNTFVGITVPSVSPANSLTELVALARAKPGELNWAGTTGANSFMFEAWLIASKLDMKKVPYRNPVDAGRDLAENRVQVYEAAVAIAQPQIELGKIKLLALLNSVRTPAYPNIPTVAEAGYPVLTIDGLVGLFGHPFMPITLRERIAADIKDVMESDPIIKDRLTQTAQLFNPGGPAEFGASIQAQRATVTAAANALGMFAK